MNDTAIPTLGQILRNVLTATGLRQHLTHLRRDKDLDDAALESRPSSTCDLIESIERVCLPVLQEDCGQPWAEALLGAWSSTRSAVQRFVAQADLTLLEPSQVEGVAQQHVTVPLAAALLAHLFKQRPAPELASWWNSPFAAWLDFAAGQAGMQQEEMLDGLASGSGTDQRTIERWLDGAPSSQLRWPFLEKVDRALSGKRAVRGTAAASLPLELRQHLAGWLMVAIAFQAHPNAFRDAVRRRFAVEGQHLWAVGHAIESVNQIGLQASDRPERRAAIQAMLTAEAYFEQRPVDAESVRHHLGEFKRLFERDQPKWFQGYQMLHDWLSARLAAEVAQEQEALSLYQRAMSTAWWRAGPNQRLLLKETLLYAVGIGAKVAAEQAWDRTHMLGLARWPKPVLDDQELRRLSIAFEQMFEPQQSKLRVPPAMEVICRERDFEVTARAKRDPNAKAKHAEGKTRRSPLMEAVSQGTLEDVRLLVQHGGDPNGFIPESGEGPLSCALRRAWLSKDATIQHYLMGLKLTEETVNRPASTRRETPLKLAIENADAAAVERLVDLGARIEDDCGHLPSALCYAMNLLQTSLEGPEAQSAAYLRGAGPPDVDDAKRGYVFDSELQESRSKITARMLAHPDNIAMGEAAWDHLLRPAAMHRAVVTSLLRRGADPNRAYHSSPDSADEWTPTLFAAQIGDVDLLRSLVSHGGDVRRTLSRPSALVRLDAMWIAVAFKRDLVVSYLTDLAV